MNKLNLLKVFENFNSSTDDYQGAMYINMFKEFPFSYNIYFDNNKELQYFNRINDFYDIRIGLKYKIDERKFLADLYAKKDSLKDINIFCYSANEYLICGTINNSNFLINITNSESSDFFSNHLIVYTNNIEEIYKFLKPILNLYEGKTTTEFGIAACDVTGSLYTSWYDYSYKEIDIDLNYNDDFKKPYEHLCNLIEKENESALILLYGDPGTGKTSIIKNLINKYPQKDFIFIDGSMLATIGQDKLMSYFLENNNNIFILEDCEKSLMNREHSNNPVMPVLLNLTDGIIGDVLGIKLICTFNTGLSNIDKALLRKGRLSMKYEFKNLSKDKTEKLLNHIGKKIDNIPSNGMPLSDIYYIEDENDFSKKESKRIGF